MYMMTQEAIITQKKKQQQNCDDNLEVASKSFQNINETEDSNENRNEVYNMIKKNTQICF